MLAAVYLLVLWFAGGAQRPDVPGQLVVRGFSWLVLALLALFARPAIWGERKAVVWFVIASVALVCLQLVPLPSSVWLALPGRQLLGQAADAAGFPQPVRALSIFPSATWNSLWALVVPVTALAVGLRLRLEEHRIVLSMLLALIVLSALYALLEVSGTRIDHPLVNDVAGDISANFANRNHFALFAAIGCLLAPIWAFAPGRAGRWRYPAALGLLLMLGLIVLATGSRAGLLLAALGIALGLLAVRSPLIQELRRIPRRSAIAVVVLVLGVAVIAVVLSVTMDRALSLERAFALSGAEDMRARALPVVLQMIREYWPVGTGFGAFDAAFRIAEPSELLSRSYFNRAHNDLLEVVLEGGIFSLAVLASAVGWWLWKSLRVWRRKPDPATSLQLAGSGVIALIIVASVSDYPARTPIIMAILVLAALWLAAGPVALSSLSSPRREGPAA